MKFQIGDTVKHKNCDVQFVIDEIRKIDNGPIQYAGMGWCGWFNEDGLCLVEEPLKVGDLVEVIDEDMNDFGDIFAISGTMVSKNVLYYSDVPNRRHFSAGKLRKLSPEEVAANAPQVSEIGKIHERLNWLQDQIDTLTEASDERFDSIEHRQGAQQGRMDGHGNGLHDLDLRVRSHTDQIRELNDGMALVRALSRAAKEARS